MILIIDTSLPGIGFCFGNKYKHTDTDKQSLDLPTAVAEFVGDFSKITAIGVVVGPGSFTGIRLGIAYAKGLSIGLKIPIVPINAFEIYMVENPDAFVAIDSGRSDLFVGAHDLEPCTMDIEQIESEQMKYPKTVGHKPYNLADAMTVVNNKLALTINHQPSTIIPMYLRPSYAETNCKYS